MYELRIAYDADTTLGEGDIRSRHEHLDEAAEAFARCAAPFKQLLRVEDGEPAWLDPDEERRVAEVCARRGLVVEEVEG
jgi:hypothetical protein